jgi:hypothetical protein
VPRLPKLPPLPKRVIPPPEPSVEVRSVEWAEEPSTAKTNASLAVYTSLLGVFDSLSPEERVEFVELAARWAEMGREERRVLLGLIARR